MTGPQRAVFATLVTTLALAPMLAGAAHREQAQGGDNSAAVFQRVCSNCHPITRVTATRRSRSQWEEVIETMISSRGAKVADDEFETIVGYLSREHGRVNVNTAPASEIVEAVGIAADKAETIVSYRRDHGKFEDFDALVKVPGLDREALEKKRDAITF